LRDSIPRYILAPMNPPEPPIAPRLLSQNDAAKYLGCAYWAVRELCWKGELKFICIGKRHCIDVRDLDAWIEKRKEQEHGGAGS
jgi:excisionase family DNA binding protein